MLSLSSANILWYTKLVLRTKILPLHSFTNNPFVVVVFAFCTFRSIKSEFELLCWFPGPEPSRCSSCKFPPSWHSTHHVMHLLPSLALPWYFHCRYGWSTEVQLYSFTGGTHHSMGDHNRAHHCVLDHSAQLNRVTVRKAVNSHRTHSPSRLQ